MPNAAWRSPAPRLAPQPERHHPQRHLAFASGSQPFSVESVALSRDAALLGVDASLAVNREVSVRLGYNGLLGSREKDHGVGLAVDWRF